MHISIHFDAKDSQIAFELFSWLYLFKSYLPKTVWPPRAFDLRQHTLFHIIERVGCNLQDHLAPN